MISIRSLSLSLIAPNLVHDLAREIDFGGQMEVTQRRNGLEVSHEPFMQRQCLDLRRRVRICFDVPGFGSPCLDFYRTPANLPASVPGIPLRFDTRQGARYQRPSSSQ